MATLMWTCIWIANRWYLSGGFSSDDVGPDCRPLLMQKDLCCELNGSMGRTWHISACAKCKISPRRYPGTPNLPLFRGVCYEDWPLDGIDFGTIPKEDYLVDVAR